MGKKTKIILATYAAAAVLALGLYAWLSHDRLEDYRLAAKYSADRAFEETLGAVDALSAALEKSRYATGGMCSRLCGEAYAGAQAAEAAMSTLPFSTQELEHISAFINVAGDYAYSLSCGVGEGFSEEQRETLSDMAAQASALSASLKELQGSINSGDVILDGSQPGFENLELEAQVETLGARLLEYEREFKPMAELEYDGKYGLRQEKSQQLRLTEEEMLDLAAEYAGVDKNELKKEYDYEGESGRRCYSAGDMTVCVSPAGLESMSQSRLVSEGKMDLSQAEEKAAEFLRARGFENMELTERRQSGALAHMVFARMENGALCLGDKLSVSIAMDDGSVYAFNAASYSGEETGASWTLDESAAAEKLPQGFSAENSRKVVLKSPGGKNLPCYEFTGSGGGRQVKIYINAETGAQCSIILGEKQQSA